MVLHPKLNLSSQKDKDYTKDLQKCCTIHLGPLALNRSSLEGHLCKNDRTNTLHQPTEQDRKCAK